ncbi:MAG: branched-chain amino acid ABC transporter permease [Methanomicrobiales archaeon]|nr:branched-chain amino acid ABC transporter permease [Methanomicrobiales archaeon]
MAAREHRNEVVGTRKVELRAARPGQRKAFFVWIAVATAFVIGCATLLLLLPIDARDKALRAITDGALLGGVYALIALGVVVVFKSSKVFNLAHGGVLMFLAYLIWWLLASVGLPLWAALMIVALASVLIGLAIDRFIMRRMIGQSGLTTFFLTLVLGFSVIQGIAILVFKGSPQIMPQIFPSGSVSVGSLDFSFTWISAFVVAAVMFLMFVAYFRFTRGGLAMRAVSESHVISQSVGISVKTISAVSWIVGCLSAAAAGVLLGSMFAVTPEIGSFAIVRALPVLLLGGIESIPGAFIGAFIIGIAESLTGTYVDPHISGFRQLLPYVLMVIILTLRPHGLFGLREIRRI